MSGAPGTALIARVVVYRVEDLHFLSPQEPLAPTSESALGLPRASVFDTRCQGRVRFAVRGQAEDLAWDGLAEGPMLVPVQGDAKTVAAALVQALDLIAGGTEWRVSLRRGPVELVLELPAALGLPQRRPSAILGHAQAALPDEGERDRQRAQFLAAALELGGPAAVRALRHYPRRRRALGAWRHRIESAQWHLSQRIGRRQRLALAATLGWVAAGGGVLWGIVSFDAGIALLASAAMALCGGACAMALWPLPRWREQASDRAARRNAAERRAEQLEDGARLAAERLGGDDPWALAARIEEAVSRCEEFTSPREPSPFARRLAEALGRDLDLSVVELESLSHWTLPRPSPRDGWPSEVALTAEDEGIARVIAGMALLIERANDELPKGWPIVLADPWADDAPDARARRLVTLARHAGGHPVVAFVTT